jgi:hypothetical protein
MLPLTHGLKADRFGLKQGISFMGRMERMERSRISHGNLIKDISRIIKKTKNPSV